jgi:GTP cyclohydrolase III
LGELGQHGSTIKDDIPPVLLERTIAERAVLRKELNKNIPELVKMYGGKTDTFCGLLEGSESAFNDVEKAVLDRCEAAMKRGMAKLMTPEEMQKKFARILDPCRVADKKLWNKEKRRFLRG